MGSNFTVFQSAVTALTANSQALSVTSQNISNINTPGYSRQTVSFETRQPQTIGTIELGLGVQIGSILRSVDSFAELRLQEANSDNGYQKSVSENLQALEAIFNEINTAGLSQFMSDFFNAFHEVSSDPESIASRLGVLGKADVLSQHFHTLSEGLDNAKEFIDTSINDSVAAINDLLRQISDLSVSINSTNDEAGLVLKDQRGQKLQELAHYLDISSIETSDGTFQVYTANGIQMVNGSTYATVATAVNIDNENQLDVTIAIGNNSTPVDLTNKISNGYLSGLISVRDDSILSYQRQIDELAFELSRQVNLIHQGGYALDGTTNLDFFDDVLTNYADTNEKLTQLRNSSGDRLDIGIGDTISIGGTVGVTAISGTLNVDKFTTLGDLASYVQTRLRAAGDGTETAVIQSDGSILVTAGASAITGLTFSISGNSAFNSVFTYPTPIAIAGTGDSGGLVTATGVAESIGVSSDVEGAPAKLAAAGSSSELPGGNSNALDLVALQSSNIDLSTGSTNFTSFYGNLLAQIGSETSSAKHSLEFTDGVLQQAQLDRERTSGVSLEEEQINLVKFQAAFQAASQLINVASKLLEILSNLG
ncbi:flagellar hook-associated protein FlgK [bacterium]|nr:flagellar hook-associated protein FlgK [bacterium]